jgi:hypothetical protein
MGVTSNYSFPVPVATDLVKNGWDAINDLGVAVDTAMNTALATKKAGMVLLNTTSFSGVASQSINDVFSATYDYYKIVMAGVNSTGNQSVPFRLRVSGTDNSTANSYVSQQNRFVDTGVTSSRSASTSGLFTVWNNTLVNGSETTVYNPFKAEPTAWFTNVISSLDTAAIYQYTGTHNQSVSYTGFTFFPNANTITGTISVFGFNK